MKIEELYNQNKDVKEYIDKYAFVNRIDVQTAFTHLMVRTTIDYLMLKASEKIKGKKVNNEQR